MKNKKLIIIAVPAGIAVLSLIIILFLNDILFSNKDKDIEAIIYEDFNEINHTLDDDTYKEVNKDGKRNDNSLDIVDKSDVDDINLADKSDVDDTSITDLSDIDDSDTVDEIEIIPEDTYDTITISAAGDVTLGRDEKFGWERTFDHELEVQKGDFGYFFRKDRY